VLAADYCTHSKTKTKPTTDAEEGGPTSPRKGRRSGRASDAGAGSAGRRSSAAADAADALAAGLPSGKKPPKTLKEKAVRLLTGWMASVVKLNGKKLLPSNAAVSRLLLPLVLWAVAVVAVFGVSYTQLQGLQAPLSSLNGAWPDCFFLHSRSCCT
jgi:hypothetical protein